MSGDTRPSAGEHADTAPDPRLVALGLVPPPLEAPPALSAPAPPPAPARVDPVVSRQPSPQPPAPARADRWTPDEPPAEIAPVSPPVMLFGHAVSCRGRSVTLGLRSDGIDLEGAAPIIEWPAVRTIRARRGAVRIEAATGRVAFVPELDGVTEPSLAPLFAEIALDASSGAAPRVALLRALDDAVAQLKYRFREEDDQFLPLFLALPAVLFALLLAVALPVFSVFPFRAGQTLTASIFLLYPRIGPLDPRVVVAAVLGGIASGTFAFQLAVGSSAGLRARGVLRGWPRESSALAALARRAAAALILGNLRIALAFLVALGVLLPFARERVLVDETGVHVRAALPMLDRDVPWSAVESATLLDSTGVGDYGATLRLDDGTFVTTRDRLFYGLSEYELYQFAQRHLRH